MNEKEKIIQKIKTTDFLTFRNSQLEKYVDDSDVVLEAVKKDGFLLKFISDRLKDNEEIVSAAIKNYPSSLGFASDRLKDNKDVVLEAVKQNGSVLKNASSRLKCDKEIVLEVISQDIEWLEFASDEIQSLLENETDKVFALQTLINKEKLKDGSLTKDTIKTKSIEI